MVFQYSHSLSWIRDLTFLKDFFSFRFIVEHQRFFHSSIPKSQYKNYAHKTQKAISMTGNKKLLYAQSDLERQFWLQFLFLATNLSWILEVCHSASYNSFQHFLKVCEGVISIDDGSRNKTKILPKLGSLVPFWTAVESFMEYYLWEFLCILSSSS